MRVLAAVAISAAVVGIVGARADADAQATKLVGSVDELARISLNNQDGTPVTTLAPATYDVEVADSTTFHNFHLTGPGADRATGVGATGTETWTLALPEGTYDYVCDLHAYMHGTFTVGAAQPAASAPATAAPAPAASWAAAGSASTLCATRGAQPAGGFDRHSQRGPGQPRDAFARRGQGDGRPDGRGLARAPASRPYARPNHCDAGARTERLT